MAGEIDTTQVVTELLPSLHSDSRANLTFWSEADLIQWMDESVKRLSRKTMTFVERDASIVTAGGTATYPLPTREVVPLHVSYDSVPLRPAAMIEMEARDPAFQVTEGTPDHWYADRLGMATVGLAPVPNDAKTLAVIGIMLPPELDAGKSNTLLQAPAPLKGYLAFSVLASAYGREGESEMPDLAQHARARVQMYEDILTQYYGRGSVG